MFLQMQKVQMLAKQIVQLIEWSLKSQDSVGYMFIQQPDKRFKCLTTVQGLLLLLG